MYSWLTDKNKSVLNFQSPCHEMQEKAKTPQITRIIIENKNYKYKKKLLQLLMFQQGPDIYFFAKFFDRHSY